MSSPKFPRFAAALLAVLALALCAPQRVHARPRPGDPLAYDLRIAIFPVAFQAGVSQSWFGSTLRAEYDVTRRLEVNLDARLPWVAVTGETSQHAYSFGAGLVWHFHQSLEQQQLSGTVYPEDAPMITNTGSAGGADHDLEMPVSQRMGGPRMTSEHPEGEAEMRSVRSLRLGFSYVRVVESAPEIVSSYVINTVPMLHAGFGWGTHWNLDPRVTGKAEIGFRRYFVDALATIPGLADYRVLRPMLGDGVPRSIPVGLRIGMQGSIDALISSAPGVGFAYSVELGALPGRGGLEGYLLVGLGLAIDVATR